MSDLVIPIAPVEEVREHPNADNLEIVHVLGWQVVAGKGHHKEGDLVVFFAPDTVLPEALAEQFGVKGYLDKHNRVRAIRLRGESSLGLVVSPPEGVGSIDGATQHFYNLGVRKWEPPVRKRGGFVQPHEHPVVNNPYFREYTHIQNMRFHTDLFDPNERVVVTEKIHGTNSRVGIVDGEFVAGSHKVQRGPGDELYNWPLTLEGVRSLLTDMGKRHKSVAIYGEIYGKGIQSMDYGVDRGYAAFDIMIDGRYLDYPTFNLLCTLHSIPSVPLAYIGTSDVLYTGGLRDIFSNGSRVVTNKGNLIEGVVVRPIVERTHPKVGRLCLKYVSDDFLLAKKSDYTEV